MELLQLYHQSITIRMSKSVDMRQNKCLGEISNLYKRLARISEGWRNFEGQGTGNRFNVRIIAEAKYVLRRILMRFDWFVSPRR
jgi:hypothetical protein